MKALRPHLETFLRAFMLGQLLFVVFLMAPPDQDIQPARDHLVSLPLLAE